MEIAKLQASKRIYPWWREERERVHMVVRLTKTSITLSRYFCIAQVGSSVLGITSLYIRQPSMFLSGQIKHWCFFNILNGVLVFKLSAVQCCTCATISIQGQLYRYLYRVGVCSLVCVCVCVCANQGWNSAVRDIESATTEAEVETEMTCRHVNKQDK